MILTNTIKRKQTMNMGNLRQSMTEEEWNTLGKQADAEKKYFNCLELMGILNGMSSEIYKDNAAKGFWDKERNVGEMLMLVVSELGEAMEAHRKNRFATWKNVDTETMMGFEADVKDTFEDEIADSIIRLLDMCGGLKIDIDRHIQAKLKYNKSRPRLHGKSY